MKSLVFSLVLCFGLVASGCGVFDVYRDKQIPPPIPPQTQDRQTMSQVPPDALTLPPALSPSTGQLPPYWYWADQQRQEFDRYVQQQWMYYYQNRQPPPQFPRQPICTSTLLGGQIITTCR